MEFRDHSSLLDTLERYRVRRFTGQLSIENSLDSAEIWFVRGNLAHVANRSGETGWKALEALKGGQELSCMEYPDVLPPQRSIRVETGRLLKAMKSANVQRQQAPLRVPVPLHLRLQSKFMELRGRITGLRSFEANHNGAESLESGSERMVKVVNDRVILERDPRGCTWTHRNGDAELTVRGDEGTTTSELMWAGEEMWREYERLNRSESGNEQ